MLEEDADVILRVCLRFERGQRLIIMPYLTMEEAQPEAFMLIQIITEQAYKAGARYVHIQWHDQQIEGLRLLHADTLEDWPAWESEGILSWYDEGAARIAIAGQNPDGLSRVSPERFGQAQRYSAQFTTPLLERITSDALKWTLANVPVRGWARRVYPDLSEAEALEKLWDAIFEICRVTAADPLAAWEDHVAELGRRNSYMTRKQYAALHYTAPGTDLTIGLPKGHLWLGGFARLSDGRPYIGNIPIEEIFTVPHREQVNGVVSFSLPLAAEGNIVEGASLRSEAGRVVEVTARTGRETLERWLAVDDNARYLGELALVPNSSSVARMRTLFYDGLYDENAASHLAIGTAYKNCLSGGAQMTDAAFLAAGGNISAQHLDFMVGSGQMNIDGILEDGSAEPVMRAGEWAFA